MEKYRTFDVIRNKDIESFSGLEKEISLAPMPSNEILPIEISRFGITHPAKRGTQNGTRCGPTEIYIY